MGGNDRLMARWWILGMNNKFLNIIGWLLFVVSSLCFIVSSVGNFWAMAGSIIFFFACIVFLAALFRDEET